MKHHVIRWLALALVTGLLAATTAAGENQTETVFTMFLVKAGNEDEFIRVYAEAWETYNRFDMVLKSPHLLLRGTDDAGRPYFVEVLTWVDASKPDHAPPEVTAIWDRMWSLCEKREDRRRIEFHEVQVVDS